MNIYVNMIFFLIDFEFDFKITLRIWNPEKHHHIIENPQNFVIFISVFNIPIIYVGFY